MSELIPIPEMVRESRKARQEKAVAYLGERTGTYNQRCVRYMKVLAKLRQMGLTDGDMIVDIGAGWGDFDFFLRCSGFRGRYMPVDACYDGTDLNLWVPTIMAEFFICIETLEHLLAPGRMMHCMEEYAKKGVVATTPNSLKVDTLGMDSTHITALYPTHFLCRKWNVEETGCFGGDQDTLLAWKVGGDV